MRSLTYLLVALSMLASACASTLDDPTPYVSSARVLAVRLDPPEVKPGKPVTLTALYADASGALVTAPLDWAFCTAPKPLAELGPVSRTCLDPTSSTGLIALGSGLSATGNVPNDACSVFGPNPPPAKPGQPGGRPVDPDITGGFYQPAMAFPTDGAFDTTLSEVRITCGLSGVSTETSVAFNRTYRPNSNPSISNLSIVRGNEYTRVPPDGTGEPPVVAPNDVVTLEVTWPSCPTTSVCGDGICSPDEDTTTCQQDCLAPVGCGGAETYVVYDLASAALTTSREALSVTYFAASGTFENERTGQDGTDFSTSTTNEWTAPATPGDVYLAVVLRDERGGVTFESYRIRVAP